MTNRSGLATTAVLHTKTKDVGNRIPDTNGLVIAVVLNIKIGEFDNKLPEVSGLVKKTDYSRKRETLAIKAE